jgi:hypothetical protein
MLITRAGLSGLLDDNQFGAALRRRGPGRHAAAATDAKMMADILSYSRQGRLYGHLLTAPA